MSLECSECERDLRGGHDPSCSRYGNKKPHGNKKLPQGGSGTAPPQPPALAERIAERLFVRGGERLEVIGQWGDRYHRGMWTRAEVVDLIRGVLEE